MYKLTLSHQASDVGNKRRRTPLEMEYADLDLAMAAVKSAKRHGLTRRQVRLELVA